MTSASPAPSRPPAAPAPTTSLALPPALRALLPRMALVREYREQLLRLQGAWDLLALLGPMSGIGSEIGQTRDDFHHLTDTLVASLARQLLRQRLQGLRSRAQVTIDILVRNLFERTADIGFLATDGPLRACLQAVRDGTSSDAERQALQARLQAYVRKYSVYDDVLLLGTDGRVLTRLVDAPTGDGLRDAGLAAAALRPATPYVERFGASELLGGRPGLIYAAAVSDDRGQAIGVLCLSFRLADEMRGVFAHLLDGQPGNDASLLALLDDCGTVIAASDPWQLPVGACLQGVLAGGRWLVRFAGREYLAVAAGSGGYQGYAGPGWQAVALIPAELAFCADAEDDPGAEDSPNGDTDDLAALAEAIDTRDIFDAELRGIPTRAQRIQRELARSVWNGRLARAEGGGASPSSSAFARTFLEEVSRTGRQIEGVFDQAISRLHTGAIAEILDQARFQARLAVDIMDRNLYERANDCRWWALTPALRQALATPAPAALDEAGRVLRQINRLYTVYTLLVLFDAQGRIVAVSDPARREQLLGQPVDPRLARATLALRDPEQYEVAAHRCSSLYGDRPTCVYAAALTAEPGLPGAVDAKPVGGIAIVFDGAPQFEAMLGDALPRSADGRPLAGAIGLLVSRSGSVVASTDARFAVAGAAPFAAALVDLRRGAASRRVVTVDGVHYAAGVCQGSGYREYRHAAADSVDDVAAVVLLPLGRGLDGQRATVAETFLPRRRLAATDRPVMAGRDVAAGPVTARRARRQIAAFSLGSQWFGFDADDIEEVLGAVPLIGLPHAPSQLAGLLRQRGRVLPVVDAGVLLAGNPAVADGPVLVCRTGAGGPIGVRVDALGQVFDVDADDLVAWQPAGQRARPVELLGGESGGAPAMLTVCPVAALGLDGASVAAFAAAASAQRDAAPAALPVDGSLAENLR